MNSVRGKAGGSIADKYLLGEIEVANGVVGFTDFYKRAVDTGNLISIEFIYLATNLSHFVDESVQTNFRKLLLIIPSLTKTLNVGGFIQAAEVLDDSSKKLKSLSAKVSSSVPLTKSDQLSRLILDLRVLVHTFRLILRGKISDKKTNLVKQALVELNKNRRKIGQFIAQVEQCALFLFYHGNSTPLISLHKDSSHMDAEEFRALYDEVVSLTRLNNLARLNPNRAPVLDLMPEWAIVLESVEPLRVVYTSLDSGITDFSLVNELKQIIESAKQKIARISERFSRTKNQLLYYCDLLSEWCITGSRPKAIA